MEAHAKTSQSLENRRGGDFASGTRSSLMYETLRIVEKLKPKYVIWENVKNLISKKHRHNFDNYLEKMKELGYTNYYQVLNAKDYGIPQNRERVFTISIREFIFPDKQKLKLKLKDMLEPQVDEKYYLSEKMLNYIVADNEKWTGNNEKSIINKTIASAINTGEGSRRCDASNYVAKPYEKTIDIKNANTLGYVELKSNNKRLETLVNNTEFEQGKVLNMDLYNQTTNEHISQCLTEPHHNSQALYDGLRIRKLTPKECWRLMGFTDEEFEKAKQVNSNAQLYKQAGNSIVVNVLEAIFENLLKESTNENQ